MRKKLFLPPVILLFTCLTLIDITTEPLFEGDLNFLATASRPLNLMFIRTGVPHPPFSYFIFHLWNEIFGIGQIASRILPLIFGILSVIAIHRLAELMFNQKVANLSSIFFAISPLLVRYSSEVDKYSLFVFLSILNFYTFIKFLRSGTRKRNRKRSLPLRSV